eukprot:SAG31_NODE_3006_length_4794_cov_3.365495_5_plen_155_part_00
MTYGVRVHSCFGCALACQLSQKPRNSCLLTCKFPDEYQTNSVLSHLLDRLSARQGSYARASTQLRPREGQFSSQPPYMPSSSHEDVATLTKANVGSVHPKNNLCHHNFFSWIDNAHTIWHRRPNQASSIDLRGTHKWRRDLHALVTRLLRIASS